MTECNNFDDVPIGRVSDNFDLYWVADILDHLYVEYKLSDSDYDNLLLSILEK